VLLAHVLLGLEGPIRQPMTIAFPVIVANIGVESGDSSGRKGTLASVFTSVLAPHWILSRAQLPGRQDPYEQLALRFGRE
jgi:hypothetical protein